MILKSRKRRPLATGLPITKICTISSRQLCAPLPVFFPVLFGALISFPVLSDFRRVSRPLASYFSSLSVFEIGSIRTMLCFLRQTFRQPSWLPLTSFLEVIISHPIVGDSVYRIMPLPRMNSFSAPVATPVTMPVMKPLRAHGMFATLAKSSLLMLAKAADIVGWVSIVGPLSSFSADLTITGWPLTDLGSGMAGEPDDCSSAAIFNSDRS